MQLFFHTDRDYAQLMLLFPTIESGQSLYLLVDEEHIPDHMGL